MIASSWVKGIRRKGRQLNVYFRLNSFNPNALKNYIKSLQDTTNASK